MEIMGCDRFKLVGFEGSFYTELRISVLPYLKPTPICKEGMPNQIDKSRFQFYSVGFSVWDVRNKIKKKERRRQLFGMRETRS